MGLKREGQVEAKAAPEIELSRAAKSAMIWFLCLAEDEMDMKSARAVIRARHGLHVEQEIRAFVAGLTIKEQSHNVRPVKGERGRYEVESESNRGEHYLVDLEEWVCPCEGFKFRKHCSHIDSAIAFKTGQENPETDDGLPI